ncbi:MAG: phosphoesterase [Caudoviricetes sp.]|nr:MAG: phosphoesterase [Caudoviricetes sp.]
MRFIGDIHAKYEQYAHIKNQSEKSLQVGDFGWGFSPVPDNLFNENDRYILGNHDHPQLGRENKHHLESGNEWEGIFPVNGAMSTDKHLRISGRDWWPEEEHTTDEFYKICDMWENSRCDILVAHDCPSDISHIFNSHHSRDRSKTKDMLSSLIYIRKPKIMIFGHHHVPVDELHDNVRYICLPELGYIDL